MEERVEKKQLNLNFKMHRVIVETLKNKTIKNAWGFSTFTPKIDALGNCFPAYGDSVCNHSAVLKEHIKYSLY